MRPFQHWLSQLYSYCQTEAHSQQDIVSWSNRIISLILQLLSNNHLILAKIAAQFRVFTLAFLTFMKSTLKI